MDAKIVSETEDFKMFEIEYETLPDGNVRAFRCCEELVSGMWEGFVSVVGTYTNDELRKKKVQA